MTGPRVTPAAAPWLVPPAGLLTYVGGIGQLFQSDHDVGRIVVERLDEAPARLPAGTLVEDLSYGAIQVSHRLRELAPVAVVLVGTREIPGRPPGTLGRRRIRRVERTTEELQGAIHDAYTGYVDLEVAIDVCWALDALPRRTIALDVEPGRTGPGEGLSTSVDGRLDALVRAVRRECHLTPIVDAASDLRDLLATDVPSPGPAVTAISSLLRAIDGLDRDGRWGSTFHDAEAVRLAVAAGNVGDGFTHEAWGLTWAIIEECARLEALSVQDDAL